MVNSRPSQRLNLENQIMARELPHFKLYVAGQEFYFRGWHQTRITGRNYQLKLIVPLWYPDEMPRLYVLSPNPLYRYGSHGTINSLAPLHALHINCNGPNDCVQICCLNQEEWNASLSCVSIIHKGLIWCEAYEEYLRTGEDIANILDKWKGELR